MSIAVRVCAQVVDRDDGQVLIEYDRAETVLPERADGSPEDHRDLIRSVLARFGDDAIRSTQEQVGQLANITRSIRDFEDG